MHQHTPHEGHTNYDPAAEKAARTEHSTFKTTAGQEVIADSEVAAHTIKAPAQKPSIGRIVHYVLPAGRHKGEHRPAIIVKIWSVHEYDGSVQLQVFTDSTNDFTHNQDGAHGLLWATSVTYSEEATPGTYHWPERD